MTIASPSRAREGEVCAHAAERTQELRDAKRFVEAREQALVCQRDACPPVIRTDCERWLAEIDAALPSVSFRAEDARGEDRSDVEVWVDGKRVLTRLDGLAFAIDPGPHQLVFRARGLDPVTQELLVAQGEKNRRVLVRFAAASPNAGDDAAKGPARASLGPWPWVLGGVAVVALGSAAFFGARALSKHDDLEATCAPKHACTQSQHDALFTTALAADISLGAALLAAGGATWLVLRNHDVAVTPATGGAVARWAVSF